MTESSKYYFKHDVNVIPSSKRHSHAPAVERVKPLLTISYEYYRWNDTEWLNTILSSAKNRARNKIQTEQIFRSSRLHINLISTEYCSCEKRMRRNGIRWKQKKNNNGWKQWYRDVCGARAQNINKIKLNIAHFNKCICMRRTPATRPKPCLNFMENHMWIHCMLYTLLAP